MRPSTMQVQRKKYGQTQKILNDCQQNLEPIDDVRAMTSDIKKRKTALRIQSNKKVNLVKIPK